MRKCPTPSPKRSFIPVDPFRFLIQGLPCGVFSVKRTASRRVWVAIGDHVLDLGSSSRTQARCGPRSACSRSLLAWSLQRSVEKSGRRRGRGSANCCVTTVRTARQ
ncbi:MAG: hypothetical protein U1E61_15765 [Bradyrhizobium sp.]